MGRQQSWFTGKPSKLSFYLVVIFCIAVSCQQNRPRLVSRPSSPLIGKRNGNASFVWAFELLPKETWNNSLYELSFGLWSSPGYLKKKLMAIDRRGRVLVRPNYENKISCQFNMSHLQVAFTLLSLSTEDEKRYGLHVEFELARSPLIDTVMLRIQDPPRPTSPLQRNATVRDGDQNVPSTPSPSKASISPVLISVTVVITVCAILLIPTLLILGYRRRLKRNIPYEPQIDTKILSKHSVPATI